MLEKIRSKTFFDCLITTTNCRLQQMVFERLRPFGCSFVKFSRILDSYLTRAFSPQKQKRLGHHFLILSFQRCLALALSRFSTSREKQGVVLTCYLFLSQPDIASRKAEKCDGTCSDQLNSSDKEISEKMDTKQGSYYYLFVLNPVRL